MATWKKVAVSGSNISQFNNDSGYLTSATSLNAFSTASFNGTDLLADSSQGQLNFTSGSGGEAGLLITATAGTDTLDFSLGTGAVPNAALANSTISGKALGTNLDDLTVDDSTLELNTGTTYNGSAARTINVKAGGITTNEIADSLGTIGVNSFTGSFSGSFTGDVDIDLADLTAGAGLFGSAYDGNIAREFSVDSGSLAGDGLTTDATAGTLEVQADSTTGGDTVPVAVSSNGVGLDLTSIDGTGIGTSGAGELELDLAAVIATDGANRVLTSDGDGTLTAEANFTFDSSTLTVTGNQIVTGDLTVQGTASFQNTEELQVADRFVLFASGSNTAGDGGIVVQQGTQNVGELFAYDSATTRWGLTSSFDASNTAYTPDAFMAAVVVGADADPDNAPARYDAKGNIFVGTDEGIWIYS